MVGPYIYWEKLLSTNKGRVLLTNAENSCRLGNVEDGTDQKDAVNLGQVQQLIENAVGGSLVIGDSNNIVPTGTGTVEDPIILNVQDVILTTGDNFLNGTLRTSTTLNDTKVNIRPDQGGILMERSSLDASATYKPEGLSIANTATSATTTVSAASVVTPDIYAGNTVQVGTEWRMRVNNDGNLVFEKYDGATWVIKSTIVS